MKRSVLVAIAVLLLPIAVTGSAGASAFRSCAPPKVAGYGIRHLKARIASCTEARSVSRHYARRLYHDQGTSTIGEYGCGSRNVGPDDSPKGYVAVRCFAGSGGVEVAFRISGFST